MTAGARRVARGLAFLVGLGSVRAAYAQAGSQFLRDNRYAVEFFQGPLLAPIRVSGLGGAYVASAEGVEGAAVNAASPAVRDPHSHRWFDIDVNLSVALPGAFARTDFDNRGNRGGRVADFVNLNVGTTLQFGAAGGTVTGDLQQYSLTPEGSGGQPLTLRLGRFRVLGALSLARGQLSLGAGVRAVTLQILSGLTGGDIFAAAGGGPEIGALFLPTGRPFRLGATFRAPQFLTAVTSDRAEVLNNGVRSVSGFVVPERVLMPWETEFGVAYQLGPRPLNPGWINPNDHEREARERILSEREQRRSRTAARLATFPEALRGAETKLAERDEASETAREDERLRDLSVALREMRRARYENWPRERLLLLASALVTAPTGASERAISVSGFLDQKLEYVGRTLSVTPRFGLEGEPIFHWLKTRVGTYIEPSRYDFGTSRQHFTFGAEAKTIDFDGFGLLSPTTWRASFFVDVAPRYFNGGIGIGTWH